LIHSLLREPVLNTKDQALKNDIVFGNLLFLQQQSPLTILNHLYPKVFPLHELWRQDEKGIEKTLYPGTVLENGCTLMPSSIPCDYNCFEIDGVYFVDCG